MKRTKLTILLMLISIIMPGCVSAQSTYDLQKPFGFCTMSSRTDRSSTYNLTGGGGYIYNIANGQVTDENGNAVASSSIKVLKATDVTKDDDIKNAVKNYSVVVFDGSAGDFTINKQISLDNCKNKTLLGINNARLCTKFVVTPEIQAALDAVNVKRASTESGTGGAIQTSNGTVNISEQAEYLTRKTLIEYLNDNSESYRNSGIFKLASTCENVIIRNITFVGPGSIDCGGYDPLWSNGAKHVWVDHCAFLDGMDGNLDITNSSDFFTVSWCTFGYTSRSYMHQNTNLIGSSDSEATGYLNTTYANNIWGAGCKQRMPMARVGKIHLLNNYYNCAGASKCINPRKNSEFLIEGNYFVSGLSQSDMFGQKDATAYVWTSDNVASVSLPSSKGSVTVPYDYPVNDATTMKDELTLYAGPTLFKSEPVIVYSWIEGTQIGGVATGYGTGVVNSSNMTFANSYNTATNYVEIVLTKPLRTADEIKITYGINSTVASDKAVTVGVKFMNASGAEIATASTSDALQSQSSVTSSVFVPSEASACKTIRLYRNGGTKLTITSVIITRESNGNNTLSLDETTESPEIVEGDYDEVKVSRTLKANTWNTFCVPFAMNNEQVTSNFGDDAEVKVLNGVQVNGDDVLMTFTASETVEAGVPYMVRVKNAVSEIRVENAVVAMGDMKKEVTATDGTVLTFFGNYGKQLAPQGSYIISNNVFYLVDSDVNLKGFRGYFVVDNPASHQAKTLSFVFDDATSINGISDIVKDNKAYNILGQRVDKNTTCIIIINGKKYVNR